MDVSSAFLGVIVIFATILFSVVLHEVMHGFVALKLGDDTAQLSGRLTLNPLKHIDPFATLLLPIMLYLIGLPPFAAAKPVPIDFMRLKYQEGGMALVAIAGPLTNLVIAVAVGIFIRLGFDVFPETIIDIARLALQVNLSLFVFNMIPFPPLDGSRLLYALAPEPIQDFMRFIESMGLAAIFIFMFVVFPFVRPVLTESVMALERLILL